MSKHGDTERYIIDLFSRADTFSFEANTYRILKIGKPRPQKGECKTDIYILACDTITEITREIKISVKQSDADFLENKISLERATEIFGEDTVDILTKSIKFVENSFYNDFLIYYKKGKRTEEKCIKIGWKFELINKHGGERSGEIILTNSQKIDVYSGTNLCSEKKDAKVNGYEVKLSGVANYILEIHDTSQNLEFYLNNLESIEEFAVDQDIYFACKAINYRSQKDKWDGNRPLSVFIEWRIVDGVVNGIFVLDKPLQKKANEIGQNIRSILNKLNISSDNFDDLRIHLNKNVRCCDN